MWKGSGQELPPPLGQAVQYLATFAAGWKHGSGVRQLLCMAAPTAVPEGAHSLNAAARSCLHCPEGLGSPESPLGHRLGKLYFYWHFEYFDVLIREKWCNTVVFLPWVKLGIYLLCIHFQKFHLLLYLPHCSAETAQYTNIVVLWRLEWIVRVKSREQKFRAWVVKVLRYLTIKISVLVCHVSCLFFF